MGQSVEYQSFDKSTGSGIPIYTVKKSVLIKGGAHVAARDENGALKTPSHYVTEVSDEDFEVLESSSVFRAHRKDGFIVAVEKPLFINPSDESVLQDMEKKDKSAQKTEKEISSDPKTPKIKVLKGAAEKGFDPEKLKLSSEDMQD